MAEATFRVEADEITIQTSYQHRERCQRLSDRRWNPERKVWVTPATSAAAREIREAFKGVGQCRADKAFQALLQGAESPTPSAELYPYPERLQTDLWQHQSRAVRLAYDKPGFLFAHDVGAGKTLSAITLAATRGHQKILIFCPKRVISHWSKQLRQHVGDAIFPIALNRGSIADRIRYLDNLLDPVEGFDPPYAVILNYEAVATKTKMRERLRKIDWDLLILDESHRIKAPGGSTSKWLAVLASKIPYRVGLSGTPLPHSPLDIYAQYRTLDPTVFGTNFTAFKARYATTHPDYKNMVLQWHNQDELHEKMYSIADRVETRDVIDMPPELPPEIIEVELSSKAMALYTEIETEFYVWLEQEDEEVTVPNALVKLLRLQQLTGGWLHTDEKAALEVDTAKREALTDLLADLPAEEPVVVFAQFHHDLDSIKLAAEASSRRYGEISGRVDESDYEAWQRGEIDLIAVQMQAGGEGLDELVRSRFLVYWSTGFSLGRFRQSRGRLLRPGQSRSVIEYHLVAAGTVDEQVLEALQAKAEIVEYILRNR